MKDQIEKQAIEEMREMANIMTEAARSACEDIPLMPSDTSVCYNIPCHRCKETRLLVYRGYRKQSEVIDEFARRFENAFSELQQFFNEDTYENLVASNDVLGLLDKIVEQMKGGAE